MGANILTLALLATATPIFLSMVNSECVDKVVDCVKNKVFCYSPPAWETYMKRVCQKTCSKHCAHEEHRLGIYPCNETQEHCRKIKRLRREYLIWMEDTITRDPRMRVLPTERDDGGTGTGGTGNGKCGKSNVPQSRIISGVDARKGAWPWIVSLNYRGRKSHFCGASLIAPKWVLTASHCVRGKTGSQLEVIVGDHDRNDKEGTEQTIGVRRVIMNPRFNSRSLDHDIALLELERPARFTSRVQPVCLPKKGEKPAVGTRCYLAGWGSIRHPGAPHHLLQQAILPVVNHQKCSFWDGIVCAGYGHSSKTNACQGDSGGPFVCQQSDGSWVQHGVTSYVVEYCKRYTGFAMVSSYIDWIRQYIGA